MCIACLVVSTSFIAKLPIMKAMTRYRHERSEVSVVIKYLVFGFNVIFWVSVLYVILKFLKDSGCLSLRIVSFSRRYLQV